MNPKFSVGRSTAIDIRKTVTLVEEIKNEYGTPAQEALRRVAIAAVFTNPLAGAAARATRTGGANIFDVPARCEQSSAQPEAPRRRPAHALPLQDLDEVL